MKKLKFLAMLVSMSLTLGLTSCGSNDDEPQKDPENPVKPDTPNPDNPSNPNQPKSDFKFAYPDLNANDGKEEVIKFEEKRGSKLDKSESKVIDGGYEKLQFNTTDKDYPVTVYWIHPNSKKLMESRVYSSFEKFYGDLGELGDATLPEVEDYFKCEGFEYLGVESFSGGFLWYRAKDRLTMTLAGAKMNDDGNKKIAMIVFGLNQDRPSEQ